MKNEKIKRIIAVAIICVFFVSVFIMDSIEKAEMHKKFREHEIYGVVESVEFKGKFDRITLKDNLIFDYAVEIWHEGMQQYNGVSLTNVIFKGDTIVKNNGTTNINVIHIDDGIQTNFLLIGQGDIN